ncbi:MAG: hisD [Chitinophagaceae bacterium]|nr:hisD [Chitinophagaceae bacterium]
MKIFKHPGREEWKEIIQRPQLDTAALYDTVKDILNEVKVNGDDAVINFTKKFDGVQLSSLIVTKQEIKESEKNVSEDLKTAIKLAADNIKRFHSSQNKKEEIIETMPGIKCWRRSVGIEKVGIYIPGGTAPLFSTILMLAIPAAIAGCKEVVLCSPPDKEGNLHPAILFAAGFTGVTKIFKAGGVQAIAAMTYGTRSIPAVHKIFGPGNQYVTAAKQLVQQQGIAIDMPAGPSEVCVLADATASPVFIAADLLSQAEHGTDSHVLFITTDESLVNKTLTEIEKQLEVLPRKNIAEKALQNSSAVVVKDLDEAIDLVNRYAPEHLIVMVKNADDIILKVINAGSVFIGPYSPESAGDYASGTNHTLPTNGFAKAYSGVSVDSFVKKITYQELTKEGLTKIGDAVKLMAQAEGLDAHANAISVRLNEE